MNELRRLAVHDRGASKLALALAMAIVGYLALAGSWATTLIEMMGRFEARLPV